ncbi:hypothetical protein JWJ90_14770 [Desulfobulbus rhabdoformis]|uniref:hypothetical protein n=1 Tax=Desulfobulbus rhabdoformis TaxID=34032 RepID=UPI001962FE03|nr:hypothetical protein [Desulfobulbus rhabdoformis]MBM9615544.1 hypothetical protein [Desulfobulbus rhabdoformis]
MKGISSQVCYKNEFFLTGMYDPPSLKKEKQGTGGGRYGDIAAFGCTSDRRDVVGAQNQ